MDAVTILMTLGLIVSIATLAYVIAIKLKRH